MKSLSLSLIISVLICGATNANASEGWFTQVAEEDCHLQNDIIVNWINENKIEGKIPKRLTTRYMITDEDAGCLVSMSY